MGYGRRSERYPADFIESEIDVPVHPIGAVPAVDRLLSLRLLAVSTSQRPSTTH